MEDKEQCRLKYVEGWEKKERGDGLTFGGMGHEVVEAVRLDAKPNDETVKNAVTRWIGEWRRQAKPTTEAQERIERLAGCCETLMKRYVERWRGDWTGEYDEGPSPLAFSEFVEVEDCFSVPFTFADGRQTCIRGKRDGIVRPTKDPDTEALLENKFYVKPDYDYLYETLDRNQQVLTYLWARNKASATPCLRVLYDVSRRPGQRWGAKDTMKSFLERVEKDVGDKKRADHYFTRFAVQFKREELERWEVEFLRPVMEEIRAWWEGRSAHFANSEALKSGYGKSEFYDLIVLKDESPYYRRKKAHDELYE